MSINIGTRLKILSRIRAYLTLEAAKAVYNALILPIFDHCDVAWAQLSEGCSQELQRRVLFLNDRPLLTHLVF